MNRLILFAVMLATFLLASFALYDCTARAQALCWPIPNGSAVTFVCNNSYWITQLPDGTTVDGNGVIDPNAAALGSTIILDKPGAVRGPITPVPAGPGQWMMLGTVPE